MAFPDSLRQAQQMRLLEQAAGGMVIYPSFTDGVPSCSSPAAAAAAASAEVKGHEIRPCRRQEFFEHVGRQMLEGGVLLTISALAEHLNAVVQVNVEAGTLPV